MKCKAIRASERAVRAYATLVTIGMLALMVSGCFTPVDVRVETPVFSPSAGTYSTDQSVEISCETTDAVIFYTTDGAVPTTQSTPYTESIQVDGHGTVVTIMAIAALDGLADSEVAEATYTIDYGPVSTPRFSPGQGTYFSLQSIVISCSTPEATIRYTSDGSTPGTTEGTVYAGPITLDADATLKAIAYKTGRESSEVATAVYTVIDNEMITWQYRSLIVGDDVRGDSEAVTMVKRPPQPMQAE